MKTPSPSDKLPFRRRLANHLPPLPTRRGWLFLLTSGGATAVALVNVSLTTALTATFFISLTAASLLLAQFTLSGLRLRRLGTEEGRAFGTVDMPLELANRLPFPRRSVLIRERCPFATDGLIVTTAPPLGPRETLVLDRPVKMLRRGYCELSGIELIGGDPCGLFRRKKVFMQSASLRISPAIEPLSNQMIAGKTRTFSSGEGRPLGISGEGREFFGIRPYRPGDAMRSIHWRSSASRGKFMVKEYEADTIDRVTLLLDCDIKEFGIDERDNNFEYLIRAAASLSVHLRDLYCHLSFFAFDARNGQLISFTGDAIKTSSQINLFLIEAEPCKEKFNNLIEDVSEYIQPGSMVYALSMSRDKRVFRALENLQERDCEVRMLLAPRELFPPIERSSKRSASASSIRIKHQGAIVPLIASFNTSLGKLLGSHPQTAQGEDR